MKLFRWVAATVVSLSIGSAAHAVPVLFGDEASFLAATTTNVQGFDGITRTAAATQSFAPPPVGAPTFTATELRGLAAIGVERRDTYINGINASVPGYVPITDPNRVLGYDRNQNTNASNLPRLQFTLDPTATAFGFHIESVAFPAATTLGVQMIVRRDNDELTRTYFANGTNAFFGILDDVAIGPLEFLFYRANGLNTGVNGTAAVRLLIDNVRVGVGRVPPPPSEIPLPAALPMLGGALALLGFMGWRRRRSD